MKLSTSNYQLSVAAQTASMPILASTPFKKKPFSLNGTYIVPVQNSQSFGFLYVSSPRTVHF